MSDSRRRGRAPSLDPVAGNGLINRRALLGQGIALAAGSLVAVVLLLTLAVFARWKRSTAVA